MGVREKTKVTSKTFERKRKGKRKMRKVKGKRQAGKVGIMDKDKEGWEGYLKISMRRKSHKGIDQEGTEI